MVTSNVIRRVFRLLHGGSTATCYTIECNERQYIVSAAHVFESSARVESLTIFHDGAWKKLPVTVVFNSGTIGDTIVFRAEQDISRRLPVELGTDGVIMSSWAYFLGFPLGLFTEGGNLNSKFPLPFVKAGLVSAIDGSRNGLTTLYLDAHNNKGFSGGPVVWRHPDQSGRVPFRIIGTVSGYITEQVSGTENFAAKQLGANAGIMEAIWIKDLCAQIR